MKYPCVLQHAEEDCGAACLAAIANYHGRTFSLNHLREIVGTGQLGTTLLGLRRGAEKLGFNAQAVQATEQLLDHLDAAPLPMIIHWQGIHWVVLYGQQGRQYIIADPAVGIRRLNRQELTKGWIDGIMLLLEVDQSRFHDQPDDSIQGIGRFLSKVLPYRTLLLQAVLMNAAIGILSLAIPFLVQTLTDDVLVRRDGSLLNIVVIAVLVMNGFSSLFELIQANLIAHFAQRLELGLVLEFGRQILRLPLTYYESRRSGEIVSRLQDIQQINHLISQGIVTIPSYGLIALVSLVLMGLYNTQLTAIALVMNLFMTVSTILFLPSLNHKTRKLLVTEAENQSVLVETFRGAITLKTTNAAPQLWDELQNRFSRLANLAFRRIQIAIINGVFSRFVSAIATVILLWFGGLLVIRQELSIGQLLALNTMNRYIGVFITTMIGFVDEFTHVRVAAQRLAEVIEATPEVSDQCQKPWATIPPSADIICTHVNFCHPGRVDLLQDFSLTIPGGKVTALVGQSGCGKSTLVKLIAGLYAPQSGTLRFGTYNQRDLALECLRQQVVLVPQEAQFWSRSIIDNFRLGSPNVSFEQIVHACQMVGADEFIRDLPDTYQTVLGEFGANLSGGQRQRLAIARAIVTNPPILILDESTSALDPLLEAQVLDKLLFYRQTQTTIIISHRPRIIERADWIVMLEAGQLKIQGHPSELRKQPGSHHDFLPSPDVSLQNSL